MSDLLRHRAEIPRRKDIDRHRSVSPPRSTQSPSRFLPRDSLKAFLPLSEEPTSISTRGQHLPGLLQHSLSQNYVLHPHLTRRPSSFKRRNSDEVGDLEAQHEDHHFYAPPDGSGSGRWPAGWDKTDDLSPERLRRVSDAASLLMTPQMRSQRLIGNSNPRYKWEQYFKSDEELKKMKKPIRQYYERNNGLIQQYIYIDKLLDSSLPHDLIQEYENQHSATQNVDIPSTILEESSSAPTSPTLRANGVDTSLDSNSLTNSIKIPSASTPTERNKIKRTPKNLYKLPENETTPLLVSSNSDTDEQLDIMPEWAPEDEAGSQDRIVKVALYINLTANTILLILKIIVAALTSSVSVLASLVDAALDFLSTAIVMTTGYLISKQDRQKYPIGRRRLEPIGVLVFSIIMVTSFVQVALEGIRQLMGDNHNIVQLGPSALAIMASTIVIKFACWLWCRLIKNSSVQALAQDAMTDVIFNFFSIIFPLVGYYAKKWYLDPLGGVLLSLYVIGVWSQTSSEHIRNLTGASATADQRNTLLYLTMRFAKTIKSIQSLQAYHAGDKLNVEVDVVLEESMSLRDSHDLGESLQYVLESVPTVDRAFVHLDYWEGNLPSHINQDEDD